MLRKQLDYAESGDNADNEMVIPGDNVEMTIELIVPIAIKNGTKFSIREGGRTVGSGNISEIIK